MNALPPGARLCLIGAGGFGRQALALLDTATASDPRPSETVFVADCPEAGGHLGPYAVVNSATLGLGDRFVVVVSNAAARRRLAEMAVAKGAVPHSLIAGTARVSPLAQIGEGAVICDFAVVEPFARVGRHFHANVRAFVAHECVIGDFVTLAPNAICNGNVHIGDEAYIGAGAILRQGTADKPLRIGAGATVGMGAVVTKDVPDGTVVVGNPARPVER